jgi:hypothetical protein
MGKMSHVYGIGIKTKYHNKIFFKAGVRVVGIGYVTAILSINALNLRL